MDATARFAELVSGPPGDIPLDEAALLIAAHAYPGLDVAAERGRLDKLAAACPDPSFDGWRRYVYRELGFTGNIDDYHDPRNSYLNEVVSRRTGIPITLAVVGIEIGRRVGLALAGVSMPGHFLVRELAAPCRIVDPFDGGTVLDQAACRARFERIHGRSAVFSAAYLDPVGPRIVLARMLANLKAIFARRGDAAALCWVLRLRLAIPEVPAGEREELSRALAAVGRFVEAAQELEALAALEVERADTLHLEARTLRARLN